MINSCEPKHLTLFANIAMARQAFKLIMSHADRFLGPDFPHFPISQFPPFLGLGSMRVQAAISVASRLSCNSILAKCRCFKRQRLTADHWVDFRLPISQSPILNPPIPDPPTLDSCPNPNAINWKLLRGFLAEGCKGVYPVCLGLQYS